MECEICGGIDFYKESGYFYCNECQTQSQEVREHAFQEEIPNAKGKKIIKDKTEKLDNKITSWECYNIILRSLTEQLINLGAHKNLKPIVKCLWMKYLKQLEVIDLHRDVKPKLQLLNANKDMNILYGGPKKRKRKKSSDDSDTTLQSNSTRREQLKKKRALVDAHYESFSQKTTQESSSLHNETLTSLKSPSEKSEKSDESISFNKYSSKEIKKKMSISHYKKHRIDKDKNLQCHKLSYKNCSDKFMRGVEFLSPIKLYCILYLGLLINKDRIQLGDLFRFIREGHITYNRYTDIFPEEYLDKYLNINNYPRSVLFSNKFFRITTAKLAHFLNLNVYIKEVDLTGLCRRFCKELNLPDELYSAVQNIISKSSPKLKFTQKSKMIPNYEGRAMSFILFILKLLFGLDGVTEQKMSDYAQLVNNLNVTEAKMFDIMKWVEYIGYRNLVISEHHFPSTYLTNPDEVDSDLFLQYYNSLEMKSHENTKLTKEMSSYKELLMKLDNSQKQDYNCIKFPPSLTPFLEYFQMLNPKYKSNYFFQDNSLDFLLRPNKYLHSVNSKVQLKHGGANDNWIMEEIQSYSKMKVINHRNAKLIPIELSTSGDEKLIDETINSDSKVPSKKMDVQYVQKTYKDCRQHIFHKNEVYLKRISNDVKLNPRVKIKRNKTHDYVHYIPYERYWVYLQMNVNNFAKSDSDAHFNKYSNTFKNVLSECARIIEQTTQELLHEFQYSELYLVFVASYYETNKKQKKEKLFDNMLRYYVNQAKSFW